MSSEALQAGQNTQERSGLQKGCKGFSEALQAEQNTQECPGWQCLQLMTGIESSVCQKGMMGMDVGLGGQGGGLQIARPACGEGTHSSCRMMTWLTHHLSCLTQQAKQDVTEGPPRGAFA